MITLKTNRVPNDIMHPTQVKYMKYCYTYTQFKTDTLYLTCDVVVFRTLVLMTVNSSFLGCPYRFCDI